MKSCILWFIALCWSAVVCAQTPGYHPFKGRIKTLETAPVEMPDGTLYLGVRSAFLALPDHEFRLLEMRATGVIADSVTLPVNGCPFLLLPDAGGPPDRMHLEELEYPTWPRTGDLLLSRRNYQGDTLWETMLTNMDNIYKISLFVRDNGNTSVMARCWPVNGSTAEYDSAVYFIAELDASGNLLREKYLPYLKNFPLVFQPSPDGGLVILTDDQPNEKSLLYKLDSNWTEVNADTFYDFADGQLVVHPEGGFLIAGTYFNLDGFRDGLQVIRLDADGHPLWNRYHDQPTRFFLRDATADPNGDLTVLGQHDAPSGWDAPKNALIHMDGDSGSVAWVRHFLPGHYQVGRGIKRLQDGQYLIHGGLADTCYPSPFSGSTEWECSGSNLFLLWTDSLGMVMHTLLSGRVFADRDADGLFGPGDDPFRESMVFLNSGELQGLTDTAGHYGLPVYEEGPARLQAEEPDYFVPLAPAPFAWYDLMIDSLGSTADTLHFAFQDSTTTRDLTASGYTSIVRAAQPFTTYLSIRNNGTERCDSIQVRYDFDPRLNFLYADRVAETVSPTHVSFVLPSLELGEFKTIQVRMFLNDMLTYDSPDGYRQVLQAGPLGGDAYPLDNIDTFSAFPVWSWDPNDKLVQPEGSGEAQRISRATDWLTYTVRFQNTGTDTAFFVRLDDPIEANLDLGSFQMLGASHDYQVQLVNNRTLRWTFPGIRLPDSTANLDASQGFVRFRLRPQADLPNNTRLNNAAAIYFDFNPAVHTNTAFVTLYEPALGTETLPPTGRDDLLIQPNPASDFIQVFLQGTLVGQAYELQVVDLTGRQVLRQVQQAPLWLDVSALSGGLYLVLLREQHGPVLGRARFMVP